MLSAMQEHTESIFICLAIIVCGIYFVQKEYLKGFISTVFATIVYGFIFMPQLFLTGEFARSDKEPLTIMPFIVLGAMGLVTLAVIVYDKLAGPPELVRTAERDTSAIDQEEEQQEAPISLREELQNRHETVKKQIAAYSMDIGLAIRFPVMNDPTNEFTANMLKAMRTANNKVEDDLEIYQDAVDDLELTFEQAEHNAKNIALSRVSEADQQDFVLAQNLLNQIKDHATSEKSRVIYSDKLRSVVQRINERNNVDIVPQEAVREIEQYSRKGITV